MHLSICAIGRQIQSSSPHVKATLSMRVRPCILNTSMRHTKILTPRPGWRWRSFPLGQPANTIVLRTQSLPAASPRRLGVDRLTVLNWFQILRATRNICAHHQRLWDVNINAQPNLKQLRHFSELPVAKTLLTFYTQHPELRFRIRDNVITRTPAYVPFCLCAHLIGVFRPQSAWQCRFLSLLKEYLPFLRTRIPELTTETFRMPGFCDEDFLSQPLWHPEE